MSLQKTSKVRLYTTTENKRELVAFLQDRSCFEPSAHGSKTISRETSRLEFAINFLSKFEEAKKGIRNAVLGNRIEAEEDEVLQVVASYDSESVVKTVEEMEAKYNDLQREKNQIDAQKTLYEPWKTLSTPVKANDTVTPFFVVIPKLSLSEFVTDLASKTNLFESSPVQGDDKFLYLLVYFDSSQKDVFLSTLIDHKGENIPFDTTLSPIEKYTSIAEQLNQNSVNIKELEETAKKVSAENLRQLKLTYDEKVSGEELVGLCDNLENTKYLSVLEGWMPSEDAKMLQYDLQKKFSAFHMEELEITDSDDVPVILNQSSALQPTGEVTNMYGTPGSKEIDPTPYLAPFYILFFGLCLTDAGYGLILAAFTGAALFMNLPFEKSVKNVVKLFFYSGISTFILGILFGGYLGLTTEQVPEMLTYIRESDGQRLFLGQLFNPMTDLATHIMPLTYGIGFIHLLLGLVLSGRIAWINGDKQRTFFVVIPMVIAFISAGLTWGMGMSEMVYLFYAALALTVWGLGKNGNPIIRILKGLGGLLNEGLSWFQNILSYSRLFALGLATGVIAMAFNIIAEIFGGLIPGIGGIVVAIIILLFGHTLNIALNVLGAYVHSSRLQFVEFFGMFLQGGGKIFKPFSKIRKFRFLSNS